MPQRQFRHRQVDFNKDLNIILTDESEEETLNSQHTRHIHIPVPECKIVEHSVKTTTTVNIPSFYIKYQISDGSGRITEFDRYDLVNPDIQWLIEFNKNRAVPLSEEDFEKLITFYEREAVIRTREVNCVASYPCSVAQLRAHHKLEIGSEFSIPVYEHWIHRRNMTGKALIRSFQVPPEFDEVSPHVAFRPRERERRASSRNPRKIDANAIRKLELLKTNLKNAKEIFDHIKQREIMKTVQVLTNINLFDLHLKQTSFFKENAGKPGFSSLESALPKPDFNLIKPLPRVKKLKKKRKDRRSYAEDNIQIEPVEEKVSVVKSVVRSANNGASDFDIETLFESEQFTLPVGDYASEEEDDADRAFYEKLADFLEEEKRKKQKISEEDALDVGGAKFPPVRTGSVVMRVGRCSRYILDLYYWK